MRLIPLPALSDNSRFSKMVKRARVALRTVFAITAAALLAACAAQPSRQTPASVAIAAPHAPAPIVHELPPPPPPDVWTQLRASFALDDCNADPRVLTWAHRYTGNPERFEDQVREALPLLTYVADAAERAGVPGEFVMLPWVESTYDAGEPAHHNDPAGMWQIVPVTARTLGLVINSDYDGRLDPAAATPAVMSMLKGYGEEWHDWRLADMAFNAGEYKMQRVIDAHGETASSKPMRLPVGATTRDHLAKLMALACIVRDPARFDVDLPNPTDADKLALVALPKPIDLASAAHMANFSVSQLRDLNPAYRGGRMSTDVPYHLLLPQANAATLVAALGSNTADNVATTDPAMSTVKADAIEPVIASAAVTRHHHRSRHKVLRGESLRIIAARYHIDARSLRAWNGLSGDSLRPGQMLLVAAPD